MKQILLICLLFAAAIEVQGQGPTPAGPPPSSGISSFLTLHDKAFLFKITFPLGWQTRQSEKESSFFRLKASSPKNDVSIDVYAGTVENGVVDLARVVDSARKTFEFLGEEVERRRISSTRYEVSYDNSNKYSEYSKVLYVAKENHYYVLAAYSRNSDLGIVDEVLSSFVVTAPFRWVTILFLIGTTSLILHLLVPTIFLVYGPLRVLLDSGLTGIRPFLGEGKWIFLGIPLWCGGYLLVYGFDYHLGAILAGAYSRHGMDGLLSELLDLGPGAFDAAGEFISEALAEVFGLGFWPGGLPGLVLSTIVSLVINVVEVRFVLQKLMDAARLRRLDYRRVAV